jgi:hypothetical protein
VNTPGPVATPITAHTLLSSFAGLCAAWMVEMATRYFALQGGDIIQLRAWGPTRAPLGIALFLCAPTAGLQLGGVIGAWGVEHFDWTFVLWAALPPGILAIAAGYSGLPRERIQWRPLVHADLAGLIALAAALGLFSCAVSQGDRMRWFQTPAIPILYMGQLIQGIGAPLIAVPLVDIFVASLRPPAESLPAASVLNLSRVLSGTIATAWATTALRLNSEGKLTELLTNTGFYPDGRGTSLASLAAHMAHTTTDPLSARAQAVQTMASAAHRQAAVLGISSTLATLGWLLFASCLLVVLMAEFGSGHTPRPAGIRP